MSVAKCLSTPWMAFVSAASAVFLLGIVRCHAAPSFPRTVDRGRYPTRPQCLAIVPHSYELDRRANRTGDDVDFVDFRFSPSRPSFVRGGQEGESDRPRRRFRRFQIATGLGLAGGRRAEATRRPTPPERELRADRRGVLVRGGGLVLEDQIRGRGRSRRKNAARGGTAPARTGRPPRETCSSSGTPALPSV